VWEVGEEGKKPKLKITFFTQIRGKQKKAS
jgi:hypothetical protein